MDVDRLCALIQPERIRELTFALTCIPSPTGQATACTVHLAEVMTALGLDVAMERGNWPDHPSMVARLRGGDGLTVQFDGHTDTVPLPHPPPQMLADRVVGRGAADMKGSLAVMAEVAAVLGEAGLTPPGDLLFTAHDMHEAPGGLGETITDLCRRGIHGDVAVVCEAAHDVLPLVGRGMGIYEVTVVREGELCHETTGAPNPIAVVSDLLGRLHEQRRRMAEHPEEYVGPETIFVGQVHAGAFYNQVPVEAYVQGTWRFSPRKSAAQAEQEFRDLLAGLALPEGMRLEPKFTLVRPSFALLPEEPLVHAFRAAYLAERGSELPLAASPAVCDIPVFVRDAGIPCVGHGPQHHGAHGEPEYVLTDDQVACCRIYLRMLAELWTAG